MLSSKKLMTHACVEALPGRAITRGSMPPPPPGVMFNPDRSGVGRLGKLIDGRPTEGKLTDGRESPPPELAASTGLGAGAFFWP